MTNRLRNHQKGFTIIELMIATAVLSTMLVLVTVVMVNIGSLYYKGINQSRVQDDVRSIADDAVKNIQLNDEPPKESSGEGANHEKAICVGSVRYTYILGVQIGKPAPGTGSPIYRHVLWRDKNSVTTGCSPVDLRSGSPSSDGREMITSNSRLTQFSMETGSSSTAVAVSVAYGDNDLVCNPTADSDSCTTADEMPTGSPNADSLWPNYTGDVRCKGLKGDQFCATAHISTSVVRRLVGGDSH